MLDIQPAPPNASALGAVDMIALPAVDGKACVEVRPDLAEKYGVAVARVARDGRTTISGTTTHHMIGIVCSPPVRSHHTIESRHLVHTVSPGSLCICPAGARHQTTFEGSMEGIVLRVSPECLILANDDLATTGGLMERLDGEDRVLTAIAHRLEREAVAGNPNGILFWSGLSQTLLDHLATHHVSRAITLVPGRLGQAALKRLDEFIEAGLGEPLDLGSLAAVVHCSPFHFARRFRASVGISPHRYVVRRRLARAVELLRRSQESPASIAATTGFTDQSHLSKWIRRVYGTTPSTLAARS